MNTDFFIKKPVFAIVVNVLIVILGIISFTKLTVRLYPNVTSNTITVTTTNVGASAENIETFITTPIETSLSGIDGIDYISSTSAQGLSSIVLHFKVGYNVKNAMSDVSSKVSATQYLLPDSAYTPIIQETDPEATPTLWFSLTSNKKSLPELTTYFLDFIQPQLQNLTGVSEAKPFGRKDYVMRIYLDPTKARAHHMSVNEVIQLLKVNNTYPPLGSIESPRSTYGTQMTHSLYSAKHFNHLVLKNNQGELTRLTDVATAVMGPKDIRSAALFEGKPSLFIGIMKKTSANTLTMANAVFSKLTELQKRLTQDINLTSLWDGSKFIRASIEEVSASIVEATICVIVIILFFLGSFRAIFVPSIAIPISLIGVMFIQYILDYSINTFTLLAMVLAIGMVVDDAIVVLENIHRHMEDGMKPMQAALKGAREIRFSVIAMTLTLAAVFTPIGFIGGAAGQLFEEFAFTLAAAVIISGIVALTLSPMICAHTLKLNYGRFSSAIEGFFHNLSQKYFTLIKHTIHFKKSILALMIVMILSCGYLFFTLPTTLVPKEDVGAVITFINAPENANLAYTKSQTKQVNDILMSSPWGEHVGMINGMSGPNSAMGVLTLKPWGKRPPISQITMQELLPKMLKVPGVTAFPINPFTVPGSPSGMPLNFVVKGQSSYQDLYARMQLMIQYLKQTAPFILNPQANLKIEKSSFNIDIDRQAAADLGVNTSQIGQALSLALGETTVGQFILNNRSYDVISQLDPKFRTNALQLEQITVRNNQQKLVPLSALIQTQQTVNAATYPHFEGMRAITLSALPVPGFPLGIALKIVKNAAEQFFPNGQFIYDYAGESRNFIEAQGQTQILFVYALIFIYLVLSAQYESFRDPFIVLVTVPLSTLGALLALKITGSTLNMYTNVGILTLIGLISKHGILIVDFANQIQSKTSASPLNAVLEAAQKRLRPILATTAAMVLGAIPLVVASGPGAHARFEIGITIIGGMIVGTLMSLFVVPCIYLMISRHHKKLVG